MITHSEARSVLAVRGGVVGSVRQPGMANEFAHVQLHNAGNVRLIVVEEIWVRPSVTVVVHLRRLAAAMATLDNTGINRNDPATATDGTISQLRRESNAALLGTLGMALTVPDTGLWWPTPILIPGTSSNILFAASETGIGIEAMFSWTLQVLVPGA